MTLSFSDIKETKRGFLKKKSEFLGIKFSVGINRYSIRLVLSDSLKKSKFWFTNGFVLLCFGSFFFLSLSKNTTLSLSSYSRTDRFFFPLAILLVTFCTMIWSRISGVSDALCWRLLYTRVDCRWMDSWGVIWERV